MWWLKANAIKLCLLILGGLFVDDLNGAEAIPTAPAPAATTTPTSIPHKRASQGESQNATNLAETFSKILEIFDTPGPLTNDFKELLQVSKTAGLILYEAFNKTNVKKFPLNDNLRIAKTRLGMKLEYSNPGTYFDLLFNHELNNILYHVFYDIRESTQNLLKDMEKSTIKSFQYGCEEGWSILEKMQTVIGPFTKEIETKKNYSSEIYAELYPIYYQSIKLIVATYPLCEILKNGPPNFETTKERGKKIMTMIQNIQNQLRDANLQRENFYWNSDAFQNLTQKHIDEEYVNERIVTKISDDLNEMFQFGDYNIYTIVHTSFGFSQIHFLIYCTTECKSVQKYKNKNVHILRNKKSDKGYQKCDFLFALQNDDQKADQMCAENKGIENNLGIFANKIIENCQNLGAISIVREGFYYQSKGNDKTTDQGFTEIHFKNKCFGNLHVVVANPSK